MLKTPTLPASVNNDNNTTDVCKTSLLYTKTLTDGIAEISNGFIQKEMVIECRIITVWI